MKKLIKEGLKNAKLERKEKGGSYVRSNRLGFRFKGKKKKKKKRVQVRIRRTCHKEKGKKLPREHLLGSCYEFSSVSLSCHTMW